MSITFNDLRLANMRRLPLFKNKLGQAAHSEADGSDWKLSAWANATAGEQGELADVVLLAMVTRSLGLIANDAKKLERGDMTLEAVRKQIGKEAADVVTYLDILCFRAGIDLGQATAEKFNEVSRRVGCSVFLDERSAFDKIYDANAARRGQYNAD